MIIIIIRISGSNNTANNNELYGIYFEDSGNNILMNNIVTNSYYGIRIGLNSYFNTLINNTANNNAEGISLRETNYNNLIRNTANNNSDFVQK